VANGTAVHFQESKDGIVLTLPPMSADTYDQVVMLVPKP
jgi:hypothetical protein